ncbi:MAG TPA: SDR family NAD(P)-dependent oxidoreductase [Gemmatimonadales bacterium]
MTQPLSGKGALVTGGGRGIGAAVARRLAAAGAAVIVAARSESQVAGVARDIIADGGSAWAQTCDVTDPESVAALADFAAKTLSQVDILVNNAGLAHSAPLHRITLEDWQRLFAVNATGTLLCSQAFVPGMMRRGWGRVINVASVAGLHGAKYIAAYSASKHAVIGFTRSLAAEVAASGVTVNAVCPSYVDTEMTVESMDRMVAKAGITREQALEHILALNPQRRLIAPDEVAHAVATLCDQEARGINGQTMVIDGGAQA